MQKSPPTKQLIPKQQSECQFTPQLPPKAQ